MVEDRLKWYQGIKPGQAMTSTSSLRTKSAYHLKGIMLNQLFRDGHSHWSLSSEALAYSEGEKKDDNYIVVSGEFNNNIQTGLWIARRLLDEQIMEEANYKDGYLDGKIISYYKNGYKRFEGSYEKGRRKGKWVYYYNDGNIKAKGEIIDEKPIGEWIVYNRDGTIQKDEEKWRFFNQKSQDK